MNEQNKKVPTIRFKGFTNDWEQRKLGEIAKIIAGGDKDKNLLKKTGKYPVIANSVNTDGIIGYYDNEYRIAAPAITVTGRGNIGHATARYYNFTPVVRLLALITAHNVTFLTNAINKIRIFNESTGVPQLTSPQLSNYKVTITNLQEEKKIGSLLKLINVSIALQQRKLALLKQLKKGLLQKMFADKDSKRPILRFNGFTDDWEQRKLGKVIVDYKKKNNNDRLPVLTSSFQGIEYQEKHFGSKQKHDTSDYNVLPKGYMTYRNRSDNGYFKFNINKLGVTGIVSKFYPVFTTIDTNKQFLASYMNYNYRLKNHFKVVSVGTSQHVLSLRNLKKTDLLFPSKSEQDQIGEFFNLLNKRIDLQQQKLKKISKVKESFLQQMFI